MQYLKSVFAVLILASVSILNDHNGQRSVIVSANPRPGHSQLEYYKQEQRNRHNKERKGKTNPYPWAEPYRYNNAKSIYPSSSVIALIVAMAMTIIYA